MQYKNQIISRLPPSEIEWLRPHFQTVDLPLRTVLIEPNVPIDAVYFIESGLGSQIAGREGMNLIEVGVVGRDGVVGLPVILGATTSPHKTFMQIAGHGIKIPTAALLDAMENSPALRARLLQYVNKFIIHLSQTALANGRFKIQARLARWILLSHDRLDGDAVPLTHEFLGLMLGVRRAGVTEALAALEELGLLCCAKANIMVTDRDGLKAVADQIY